MGEKPKKRERGNVIIYERIPDEVYGKIIAIQNHLKDKLKRRQVSMGAAITHLIKNSSL